ncbi:cytochrome P450 6k1-like [Coccinella septempunctata]|uniref:cytochrome P450 6k1-like n=1 Tax=Coccinella septempunctata TaxID=41139 RepID=UPI001D087A78|nr:cytochrome P450 6k1-like [Coccinella septempunctata]
MMYWFVEILLLILFLLYLVHLYISRNFDYWRKRNVPFIKPSPFVGNLMDVILHKYDMAGFFEKIYNDMDVPFFGIFLFSKPALIIKDVNLMKHILVKDFDHFVDRVMYASEHDPATAHMLFIEKGDKWKTIRAKMSPYFSPSKVKTMFSAMDNLAISMCNHIVANKLVNLDVKDISSKFSVDLIAKCVFGIESKSLEIENGEFLMIAQKIFDTRLITSFRYLCYFFFHSFVRIFKIKLFDPEVLNFLRTVFWECIRIREEDKIEGNDLMDIIVELRKNKEFCERTKFEGDAVIAQALIFFVAGFETTASTIAFTLYSLCLNPDIQRKLRKDIKDTIEKHDGKLTIESVGEMSYLDMVMKETMRKYSPVPIIDRVCTRDYKIPSTDVIIEKGVVILLPVSGIQNDPRNFKEPEEYIPERFESYKEDISYLSFGHGPRACIGRRFGLLATKLAIIRVLREFEVHSTDETPVPLLFNTKSTIPQPLEKLKMSFIATDPLF